ncbi:MAG: sensor histidine kinase [Panacagrimonas sp.]
MKRIEAQKKKSPSLIPNFCSGPALMFVAVVMELVAICFTLASAEPAPDLLRRLALLSLYMQWIGLCGSAALCGLRRLFNVARPGLVFAVCWTTLILIVMVLSHFAWIFGTSPSFGVLDQSVSRVEFILRHACLAAIVSFMLLRYFWSQHQWKEQVQAEGESRYQALNARIRPHFFFNALNSLAALITIRPAEAEMMVEDLADVFRASLEKRGRMAPLVDEIGVCNAYLRIEKARLGEKLDVQWDVAEHLLSWPVPMLIIQPLVENAVYHGISKIKDRGTIRIHIYTARQTIIIEVENPLPPTEHIKTKGNQIAIDNIASRLNLIYGERGRLELGPDNGVWRARLSIPEKSLLLAGDTP